MSIAGVATALSVLVLDHPRQRCYVVVEELITADYPSCGVHKLTCWLLQGLRHPHSLGVSPEHSVSTRGTSLWCMLSCTGHYRACLVQALPALLTLWLPRWWPGLGFCRGDSGGRALPALHEASQGFRDILGVLQTPCCVSLVSTLGMGAHLLSNP